MAYDGPDFRQTWLWRQAFNLPRSDSTVEEQNYFEMQYLSMRMGASTLVSRIAADMPGLTVHDVSHLDALWDMASLIAEGAVSVNPVEAFVFGSAVLLHDAAMSVSAYPGGLEEIKGTVAWRDAVARLMQVVEENGGEPFDIVNPPDQIIRQVLPGVLRQLHAQHAEVLAEQAWDAPDGSKIHLVEDSELRQFYGPTIGKIAHSHWWPVHRIEQELSGELGAFANRTSNRVDRLKLACLLRVADGLHLDSRRAPRFLRAISNPEGSSALHWTFQERLARPHVEFDAVVFTSGQPFSREDAEAWWLAYDTLNSVHRELHDVDLLLQARGRELLKARRVKGAGSPEILARHVNTRGWRPVDARLQASDVPNVVKQLGGSKLYGSDPTVTLRELIQNAADAVQARRRFEERADDWGKILVEIVQDKDGYWLVVEDDGIGMSEQVMTGPLLDFGMSFWRSPMAMEEFPGLISAGMKSIGRFGIGFFSVFMLGSVVRVYSRRCDRGKETGRLLEFRDGTGARPILAPCEGKPVPIDCGTRVEVNLNLDPSQPGGLLAAESSYFNPISLEALVGAVAPNLDVAIVTKSENGDKVVANPGDWLVMSQSDLISRLAPSDRWIEEDADRASKMLMQPVKDSSGRVYGRAFISPNQYSFSGRKGWVTVSGLRSAPLSNVSGILLGEALTASRNSASPLANAEAMAAWASEQADLIVSTVKDEARQALCAEVVLECGGNVGRLKVAKWGSEWMNAQEFESKLRCSDELMVSFTGEFVYDEDKDEVHPRDFRDDLEILEDVLIVERYNGSILSHGNVRWPRAHIGLPMDRTSNLAAYIRSIVAQVWGDGFYESVDERVVGSAAGFDIVRIVTVLRMES